MRVRHTDYRAGVSASLVAEVVFVAIVAAVALMRGMDPWMVARMPAAFLLGPAAVQPPGFVSGDVLLGLLIHLWMAVLVGLVYAALMPRLGVSPITGGLIAAAVLYAMGFWLLPHLFPRQLAPFWLPPLDRLLEAVTHVVYGVVFGLAFRRQIRD